MSCHHRFDYSHQKDLSPNMQAYIAAPQYNHGLNWYPDTRATNHVTSELANLNLQAEEYNGSDQLRVGNGQGLVIKHLGSSKFPMFPLNYKIYFMSLIIKRIFSPFLNLLVITMCILNFNLIFPMLKILAWALPSSEVRVKTVYTRCLPFHLSLGLLWWVNVLLWIVGTVVLVIIPFGL
jgi:hypothetical protein